MPLSPNTLSPNTLSRKPSRARRRSVVLVLAVAASAIVAGGLVAPGPVRDAAAAVVPAADGTVRDDYQFSAGFSSVQGQGQWHYLQWNGSAYSNMSWDASNGWWRGNCTYCIIFRTWVHPDTNNSVIGWQAPRAGTITIRGTMDHRNYTADSDGVHTFIRKQSGSTLTKIWPSAAYQDIKPNFMAQHIVQTTVAAGDMIYFHVDHNVTTGYDTLNWDPRIDYDYQPKFTLDQAELVMTPADFQRVGITLAQDSSLSVVPDGARVDFYHSQSATVLSKFTGTPAQPAQTPVYAKNGLNVDPAGERWWISNLYRASGGGLLAFCHIENADVASTGWWALGLAYSTDNGGTWHRLGITVTQHVKDTAGSTNIFGVPYVVKDGYFYVYFSDVLTPGAAPVPVVARAPVAEVLSAATSGTVSPWQKYYAGAWDEPGLGGNATMVVPDGSLYATHGDAAYSTYLGRYLMSSYTHQLGKGVYLTFSADGTRFDVPSWIQSSSTTGKDSLSPYETIVNVDGTDNGVVGQSFYVYYSYRFKLAGATESDYPTAWRWLYRQKVTLNRAGFDPTTFNASTDFTNHQSENGWQYLEWDGSRYTALGWDPEQVRWNGSATYLMVDATTQHPDAGHDAVRVWIAPHAGTVRISTLNGIGVATGTGADGVGVQIRHNGTPIWPAAGYQPLAPGSSTAFDPIDVPVSTGDALYFHVNQNGGTAYDTVSWTPILTYQ